MARKPMLTELAAGMAWVEFAGVTVTVLPLCAGVPPHIWVMVWPAVKVKARVQPLRAVLPAVTLTSPWKPPDQELVVV